MSDLSAIQATEEKRDGLLTQYMAMGRNHPDAGATYKEVEALDAQIARMKGNGAADPLAVEVAELRLIVVGLGKIVQGLATAVTALSNRKPFDPEEFGGQLGEVCGDLIGEAISKDVPAMVSKAVERLDGQVEDKIGNVHRALDDIRDRLDRIERQPQLKYLGAWKQGAHYSEGQMVTSSGSLWHCNSPTGAQPSASDPCWTMAARKGRDAREA